MNEPRCIHRHTENTHPNCFRIGLIKRPDWWRNHRIAYLDIETTAFQADIGVMIHWCLKHQGDDRILESRITKEELFDGRYDRRLVKELLEELNNVDIVITFFGKGFDVPFIRSRAMFYGMKFPSFGTMIHWDLFFYCKRLFRLTRKSLDRITTFLGIEGKTHLQQEDWAEARYGDKAILDKIMIHNREDVKILEMLHEKMEDQVKWQRTSI
jgi:hypothetical protein